MAGKHGRYQDKIQRAPKRRKHDLIVGWGEEDRQAKTTNLGRADLTPEVWGEHEKPRLLEEHEEATGQGPDVRNMSKEHTPPVPGEHPVEDERRMPGIPYNLPIGRLHQTFPPVTDGYSGQCLS